jgi:predicted ATPase
MRPSAPPAPRSRAAIRLLLRQLLTSLEDDGVTPDAASVSVVADIGPRAVSRTVLIRLARLPDEAVSVARAVAVLGESADLPTVATLAELPEEDVAAQTAALARAEILREELRSASCTRWCAMPSTRSSPPRTAS